MISDLIEALFFLNTESMLALGHVLMPSVSLSLRACGPEIKIRQIRWILAQPDEKI